MTNDKYVGLDVHQASTSIVVLDSNGKGTKRRIGGSSDEYEDKKSQRHDWKCACCSVAEPARGKQKRKGTLPGF